MEITTKKTVNSITKLNLCQIKLFNHKDKEKTIKILWDNSDKTKMSWFKKLRLRKRRFTNSMMISWIKVRHKISRWEIILNVWENKWKLTNSMPKKKLIILRKRPKKYTSFYLIKNSKRAAYKKRLFNMRKLSKSTQILFAKLKGLSLWCDSKKPNEWYWYWSLWRIHFNLNIILFSNP